MEHYQRVKIALVGNPNSGKTSLFNHLTGLHQKVGNFPGITTEKKTGICTLSDKHTAIIIDLPGTYSMYPNTIDEEIVTEILLSPHSQDYPDKLVVVIDASNIKRNFFLLSQMYDLNFPIIVALNMLDEADEKGILVETAKLESYLQVPVVCINARLGKGLEEMKKKLIALPPKKEQYFWETRTLWEGALERIKSEYPNTFLSHYHILQLIHHPSLLQKQSNEIQTSLQQVIKKYTINTEELRETETLERYKKIEQLLNRVVKKEESKSSIRSSKSFWLDKILTHTVWGYLIFFIVLFLIFQSLFAWSEPLMNLIDNGFSYVNGYLEKTLPNSDITRLFTEGIIPGITGIVIFIPQIMFLFGFIVLLEETGYMARVVFLMDKIMKQFGMSGRSIVPLISGVACAIPAIMSTRNIESTKERIITIIVTPLMSCSARLPVYTVLIGLAVPHQTLFGFFNMRGIVLMGMYLLGFVFALLSGLLMKIVLKTREKGVFIMEFPHYRIPFFKNVLYTIFEKVKTFILEAGKIILAVSIILWILASYSPDDLGKIKTEIREKNPHLSEEVLQTKIAAYTLEHSYAGYLGKTIEPLIKPIGYDWKIGIALITSFAAREVFVGTISTIYHVGNVEQEYSTIQKRLANEVNHVSGEKVFTRATCFSLLVFYAFAMQCMSTLAIVYKETNGWKWPLIQLLYMTLLAYISAFITFQIFS